MTGTVLGTYMLKRQSLTLRVTRNKCGDSVLSLQSRLRLTQKVKTRGDNIGVIPERQQGGQVDNSNSFRTKENSEEMCYGKVKWARLPSVSNISFITIQPLSWSQMESWEKTDKQTLFCSRGLHSQFMC